MKVLNEDVGNRTGNTFVLIMDKREARTLTKIVDAAYQANKRRSSFRTWKKKIEERLDCF